MFLFEKDRWQEILFVLKENKLRTTLTAFGIFWGILMLMIMMGAGNGLRNGIYRNFGDHAVNSCFIWTKKTTMPYKGFNKDRHYNFDLQDMEMLLNKIPEIEYLSPRMFQGSINVSRNKKVEAFNILGDFPQFVHIDPMNILQGRFINELDMESQRKNIVIGKRVREVLFEEDEDPLGQYLKVNGVYFQVIGVLSSKHVGGWGDFQNNWIVMPLTTMQKSFNLGTNVGWFSMTVDPWIPVKAVEEKAITLLKAAHSVHPEDDMAVGHANVQEDVRKMNGLFTGINILVWIVGIGTLLAGVIGVSNIMLVVVRERTQEFGIQRAIGATPFSIISQLIMESVFLTFTAGYIGMFLGIFAVEQVNKLVANQNIDAFYNPDVSLKAAIASVVILVLGGILAGIIPAKRAVSMKPIDAIRSDYK